MAVQARVSARRLAAPQLGRPCGCWSTRSDGAKAVRAVERRCAGDRRRRAALAGERPEPRRLRRCQNHDRATRTTCAARPARRRPSWPVKWWWCQASGPASATTAARSRTFAPTELGAIAIKEAVARAKVDPADGRPRRHRQRDPRRGARHVPVARRGDRGRAAGRHARASPSTACAAAACRRSSRRRSTSCSATADVAVGGGAESMSRAAYFLPAGALGPAHGRRDSGRRDDRRAARPVRPRPHGHHGREHRREVRHHPRGAGRVRRSRAHRRAASARSTTGYFKSQIVPIEVKTRRRARSSFDTDEHVRKPTRQLEDLAEAEARRSRRTARSPPATPRASTTPPRPSC